MRDERILCYRLKSDPGHYRIADRDEEGPRPDELCVCCWKDVQGESLPEDTVNIVHGADSSLPGVGVVGVSVRDLIPCNCGHWREATEAQAKHTREWIRRTYS